jgi:hypothetical protein
LTEPGRLVNVIITFDQGTHASGWWRWASAVRI